MKIQIDRPVLLKHLKRCTLPGAHAGSPIHGLIWLGARPKGEEPNAIDALVLRATNGRVGVEQTVQCKVLSAGETSINSKRFTSGAAAMNGESVFVETEGARIAIKSQGERRWSDATQPPENFPVLPEPVGATWMKIRRDLMLEIISRLSHNVLDVPQDRSERRGIFLETTTNGNIVSVVVGDHMVSVNGIRDANVETKPGTPWSCLLTEAMLPLIQDVASDPQTEDHLNFYYDDNYVYCVTDATLIAAARVQQTYPPYLKVMEGARPVPVCSLPRIAMLDSLKALLAVRTDRSRALNVTISNKGIAPHIDLRYKGDDTNFTDSHILSETPTREMDFQIDPDMFRQSIDSAGENPMICSTDRDNMIALKTDSGFTCLVCLMSQPEA
jgi:DNA polymerase III sliding clamp (beta) subunit (PCNA family)